MDKKNTASKKIVKIPKLTSDMLKIGLKVFVKSFNQEGEILDFDKVKVKIQLANGISMNVNINDIGILKK